jgi:hypothetical protein
MADDNIWRFSNSIHDKKYVEDITGYNVWLTNRSLANFIDTVLFANVVNIYNELDPQMQYDYLFYGVTKGRRFAKKKKVIEEHPDFTLVQDYYKYSAVRTREVLRVLTQEQIEIIKNKKNESEGGYVK